MLMLRHHWLLLFLFEVTRLQEFTLGCFVILNWSNDVRALMVVIEAMFEAYIFAAVGAVNAIDSSEFDIALVSHAFLDRFVINLPRYTSAGQ